MKNNKFLIAGGTLLAGIILFFIGFATLGFDINKLNNGSEYHSVSYVQSENVQSITVDDDNTAISIVRSKDEKVYVDYSENDTVRYEVSYESGKLTIAKKDTGRWWNHIFNFDIQSLSREVKVALPEKFQGDLQITTSNSKISAEQVSTGNAVLTTSNGSITLSNFVAKNNLRVKTSNARVELDDVKSERTVSVKTSNGKITMKKVTSGGEISAETSNGRIEIDAIDAKNKLQLTSSNGRITGSIKGALRDFSVTSKTSNGQNNLPENLPDGQKTLVVKTSNAGIDIKFAGKSTSSDSIPQ